MPVSIAILFGRGASADDGPKRVVDSKVVDPDGNPLNGVSVTAFDGTDERGKVTTDTTGAFQLTVPMPASKRIALVIRQEGYEPLRQTVELDRPDVRVAPLKLVAIKSIEVAKIVTAEKAGGKEYLVEVALHNENKRRTMSALGLRVIGSATSSSNCIDGGAQLTFKIEDLLVAAGYARSGSAPAQASLRVKLGNTAADPFIDVTAGGLAQYRDCTVTSLTVELPHLFHMAADETKSVWIEVPSTFTLNVDANKPPRILKWTVKKVGVQTQAGVYRDRAVP